MIGGFLSKMVANNSINRSLRSICSPEREVFFGKWNCSSCIFQCWKSKRNSCIVSFSEFIILFCSYLSIEDSPLVKLCKISGVKFFIFCCLGIRDPRCANLGSSLLVFWQIAFSVGKVQRWQITSCWFCSPYIVFNY